MPDYLRTQPLPQLQQFQPPNIMGGLATVENIKQSRQQQELNRMQMEQMPETIRQNKEIFKMKQEAHKTAQEEHRRKVESETKEAEQGYIKEHMGIVNNLLQNNQPKMAKDSLQQNASWCYKGLRTCG